MSTRMREECGRDECRFCAAVKTSCVGGHHLAFKVKDLDAAVAFLKRKGVRVMTGLIVVQEGVVRAGMKADYLLDASGNQFELVPF